MRTLPLWTAAVVGLARWRSPRRVVGSSGITALFFGAACALCGPPSAQSATVTATITGKITSGVDQTGVFGSPNTDLAGDDYTAVFTFDTTKGVLDGDQTACDNGRVNSGNNTPVTQVVLTINSHTFTFLPNGATRTDSYVYASSATAPKTSLGFAYYEQYNDISVESIGTTLGLNGITVCRNWADNFPQYTLNPSLDSYAGGSAFGIALYPNGVEPPSQYASGNFSVVTVEVDGIGCSPAVTAGPICPSVMISAPTHTLWWFNGVNPDGYSTDITLEASPSGDPPYTWSVTGNANEVTFLPHQSVVTTTTSDNKVTIYAAAASCEPNDIQVTVSTQGVTSAPFPLSILTPHSLLFLTQEDHPDATLGYLSDIYYRILDQFGKDSLSHRIYLNEKWTTPDFTCVYKTSTGDCAANWPKPIEDECSANTECPFPLPPNDWADEIGGVPLANVPPPVPTPTSPSLGSNLLTCDSPKQTLVQYWPGQWWIGSATPGDGVLVQENNWYRFINHGRHCDIVSPVP